MNGDGSIRVDVVILSLARPDEALEPHVLVTSADGDLKPRLPGDALRATEDLEDAAGRILADSGLRTPRHLEQLASFGAPRRMPEGRIVSVTYLALVPQPFDVSGPGRWVPVASADELAWDHEDIVDAAVQRVRSKLTYSNIAYGLLPDDFTMRELQEVYEAVIGTALDKRNFRKKILALDLVEDTGGQRRGSHRPAALYRFASTRLVLLDDVIVSG